MVTIYYTDEGKQCIYSQTSFRGTKQTEQVNFSPLKDRLLTDNNEHYVLENGINSYPKMVTGKAEGDTNKYLHKKFKKVATLEESSPPKVRCSDDETGSPPGGGGGGRYICPYCKLACAKPSVLQKHIRAHTNERPFPCLPCGFAFKTKSNLYKHCRSRSHSKKMDDGSSGDDDDSGKSDASMSATSSESDAVPNKIYKPKFHKAVAYASEEAQPKLWLNIPTAGCTSTQSTPSPFSGSSPSPEFLHRHISKLISDNQAIVDEVPLPLKSRFRDSPPLSPIIKNGDSDMSAHSKLELALLRSESPEPEAPLNLTTKEPWKRPASDSPIRLELRTPDVFQSRENLQRVQSASPVDYSEKCDLLYCSNCKYSFKTRESLESHLAFCLSPRDSLPPKKVLNLSPGPLLGKTPLVDGFQKEIDVPLIKKRKLDLRDIGVRTDELLKSPSKAVHLFGGEVQIHDTTAGKTKTLRIEPSRKETYIEQDIKRQEQVLTISKTGLNCVGGTLIQTACSSPISSPTQEKLVLPIKPAVATPTLAVPGLMAPVQVPLSLNPLTSISGFNPLTLPKACPSSGGLVTILHGGQQIPYVPGMPGPHSLSSPSPVLRKPEKQSVIVSSVRKLKSPEVPAKAPPLIKVVETEERRSAIPEEPKPSTIIKEPSSSSNSVPEVGEKKFLRPSSLPLKPGTYTPKRQVTTPHLTLVSPETPRPRKSFGQLYLNGHAYTYLGLKCSTRTFFCSLNKPQPIYVPLQPDQYKVSMYSNWKICSDSNPHPLGLDARKAMCFYDSRNRPSTYTVANRNKDDLIAHSTYQFRKDQTVTKTSDEKATPGCSWKKTNSSERKEDYAYIRSRGRGRYACDECGIKYKKPSLLRKHLRVHTDSRPFNCKYCIFSYKSRERLQKHLQSRAHYRRCVELDVTPVPTSCDEFSEDESGRLSKAPEVGCSRSTDDSEEETDEGDDDDVGDECSDDEGESCRTEREVAHSLLSLSEVALESAHKQYVKAGLLPANDRPRMYPYSLSSTQVTEGKLERETREDRERERRRESCEGVSSSSNESRELSDSSRSCDSVTEPFRPMDLSAKPSLQSLVSKTPLAPVITSVGGQAHILKTICSTTEKAPLTGGGVTEPTENPTLLQTYLTERAAYDSRIKQRQVSGTPVEEGPCGTQDISGAKESALGVLALSMAAGKPPSPLPQQGKGKAEFMPPISSGPSVSFISSTEDGRSMCGVCNKVFNKPSQLRLHVNIHFFERPFRCESCAVSFRTKGHLQKHQRSLSHLNKVNMNSTFGTATSSNPRPFKCDDCKIAFRIHGHLAKHLRSKMHIMKLECLGKLPFGTYAELERSGMNMNDIDTTDCENSLESLQLLAQKLYEKDPSKLSAWEPNSAISVDDSSEEDEPSGETDLSDTPQAHHLSSSHQPRLTSHEPLS